MPGKLTINGHVFAEMMQSPADIRMPNIMDNDACLYYILNGRGEVYSPTEKVVIQQKDSVLMKCGSYIGCFLDASPTNMHESVGFHFHPEVVQRLVKAGRLKFPESSSEEPVSAVKLAANRQLENYVSGLMYYLEHPEEASESFLEIKLEELFTILLTSGNTLPFLTNVISRLYLKQEVEFNKVIEANVFNNLSIPELAILTNRSESTFKRDFKKYYGQSPAKYLREQRLERAAELLRMSQSQISEVAWECGPLQQNILW